MRFLPQYRYSTCAVSIWLCINGTSPAQAACSFTPSPGNDSFLCDSGSGGALTDLTGDNSLAFPATGNGTLNGNVTFGVGNDTLQMDSGTITGALDLGDGSDRVSINGGLIGGAVSQGNGVDDFRMSSGVIQSLAQGDGRDSFLMTGGTIIGAFEDGDIARMSDGAIGRVDMKLDNNLFDLSGGQILGNLVTGFGADTIIISGGRVGGNVSVSGGNDTFTLTGGDVVGEIRMSAGDDSLRWSGAGTLRSAVLMGEGNDNATLSNLNDGTLAPTPSLDGGPGTDLLTFDGTVSGGAARYVNWETINLNNGSRFDLDGVLALGDSVSGTGVFNVDASSTLTSAQGSITPFTPGAAVTLNNAGAIDLSSGNSRTSDMLTVQGNYVGNGGRLLLQTSLGADDSPSDRLVVNNGSLGGSTQIAISQLGGAGALTRQNGIQLVEAQGTSVSSSGAFTLSAPVSAGAYDYNLFKGGITPGSENSWYLRSAVVAPPLIAVANPDPSLPPILVPLVAMPVAAAGSPALPAIAAGAAPIALYRQEVPVWSVLPPAAAQLTLAALGTFHDRQGDQRLLSETGSFGAGWGRAYGRDFDQTWAGTVTPRLDGSLEGFQVGNDLYAAQTASGHTWRSGFFVGHSRLRGDVDGFNQGFEGRRAGKVELEGDHYGLYSTLTAANGGYVDAVVMGTRLDGDNRSERGLKLDNRGHALTVSAEAGLPFAVTGNWELEPQVQVIHQKVSLDSQDDGVSRVSFDSDGAWTGRVGARLKGRYDVSGRPLEPYARINLWHTFSAADTVTFDGADQIDTQQRTSSAELGMGVIVTLAQSVSAYAGMDYSGNIDSQQQRGTRANIGLRVSW